MGNLASSQLADAEAAASQAAAAEAEQARGEDPSLAAKLSLTAYQIARTRS